MSLAGAVGGGVGTADACDGGPGTDGYVGGSQGARGCETVFGVP